MYTNRQKSFVKIDAIPIIFIILGFATLGRCSEGKRLQDCNLIRTDNGNCGGGTCVLPFIYKTKIVFDTSTMDYLKKNKLWCSCTQNYDLDMTWGEATTCASTTIGCNYTTYTKSNSEGLRVTSPGADCVFPFTYTPEWSTQPITLYDCTKIGYENKNRNWCSTTSNYDKDKLWGECTNVCGSKTQYCDLDIPSTQRVKCKTSIIAVGEEEARNKCFEAGCCYNSVGENPCFEKLTRNINECELGLDNCHTAASCEDTETGFTCTCKTGYTGDGENCGDINECSSITCTGGTCQNTEGSYSCVCQTGYAANSDNTCQDVDECTNGESKCDRNAVCTNTDGGHNCKCPSPYTGDGFTCGCDDWKYTQVSNKFAQGGTIMTGVTTVDNCKTTCSGVDACASFDQHDDGIEFMCYWFEAGIPLESTSCSDNQHNHWKKYCGEETTGVICADKPCGANYDCTESGNTFKCTCKDGYESDTSNTACTDKDECAASTSPCPSDSVCKNTVGSYECQCNTVGYVLSNGVCKSSSELACTANPCDSNAVCKDTGSTYSCTCNSGYEKDATTQLCGDIDECTTNSFTCQSNSQCSNTAGGYVCNCNTGYTLTGSVCKETSGVTCADNPCDANEDCTTTGSTFTCACKSGFKTDSSTKKCVTDGTTGLTCADNPCGTNAVCTDSGSTYTCTCNSGYQDLGNTNVCSDINECKSSTICGSGQTCANTDGSYTCNCASGFYLDNSVCKNCFTESTFTQMHGGIEQSNIKTTELCKSGCLAVTEEVCAGFDYAFENARCFFHELNGYATSTTLTVNWNISHFKRIACFTAQSK